MIKILEDEMSLMSMKLIYTVLNILESQSLSFSLILRPSACLHVLSPLLKACPASACSLLLLQYPAAAAARWSRLHLRLSFFLADAAGGESGRAVGGESMLKRDLGVLLTSLLWLFRGRDTHYLSLGFK